MDYHQKYLKYKAKYVATQTGGGFIDASGANIALELQALDDAFLPGFNVDARYVEPLLAAASSSKNSLELIHFLQSLNTISEKGLNIEGNRLSSGQTKQTKDSIGKSLNDMTSTPDGGDRKDALELYKQVSVNYDLATTDPAFQALDDAFLPGFNVDKAYVGHLYVLCQKSETTKDVINGLIILNGGTTSTKLSDKIIKAIQKLKKKDGLNAKGDRLSIGQNKKVQKAIEKELNVMLLNPDDNNRKNALENFKAILNIKNKSVPETPKEFQALDDAFLPGFNVDKAYVGHLYMLCKTKKSTTEVIDALIKLNNASVGGLNYIGDRLTISQTQQSKDAIKTALKAMLSNPDDNNRKNALENLQNKDKIITKQQ